ncbi:recombinase family protein [Frankia sp. CNm7]|uniref:Recombinase family protein n=1 Tax=Frankia nepalensis TaxID=1836974 RepID=A0A937RQS6_9ACTN|nr:recombinase family protein [Frankia nepalensis]MBL7496181.1 recombinase family protein [Frankia nepalensis]MBL7511591.1 recombinase family protein [Frankia nepalensis]MBL7520639.1 recombinase family protein [Frankia nepalensis]MBL7630266.1 recombinase family protein [Frankia nepalensis]
MPDPSEPVILGPAGPAQPSAAPSRRRGFFARRRAAREAKALAEFHARTNALALLEQIAIVRAGYHLGPIPYGYQPLHLPVTGPDGVTRRRTHLIVDPLAASEIIAIFRMRVEERLSPALIAVRLAEIARADAALGGPVPGNPGGPRLWTPQSVARVLGNPVYTGASVWGRVQRGRRVHPDGWVICPFAHQPLVDGRTFHRAQLLTPPASRVVSRSLPPWEFGPGSPPGDGQVGAAA